MTYLFTNPQVKKWKTLFFLSFFLNIILAVLIVYTVKSGENEEKSREQAVQTANSDDSQATQEEQSPEVQAKPETQAAEKEPQVNMEPG